MAPVAKALSLDCQGSPLNLKNVEIIRDSTEKLHKWYRKLRYIFLQISLMLTAYITRRSDQNEKLTLVPCC